MDMNTKAAVKFADGTAVKSVEEAEYLGSVMTSKHLTRKELERRLRKALVTCMKLKTFWRKAVCSVAWKLKVYNAVDVSKLTYGLDSLQLIDSLKTRINAFQIRGLRQILRIEHADW